jgi:hypothetical protein
MVIGMLGFFLCWIIGWNTYNRVFSDPDYKTRSETRSESVVIKGTVYFVEPDYGWYFELSDQLIQWCFLIGISGGAYVEFRKRADNKQ